MANVNVVNTRTTPYIVDDDGRLLAGGEHGQVDDTQPRSAWALEQGILLAVDTPAAPSPAPAAPPAASTPGETD